MKTLNIFVVSACALLAAISHAAPIVYNDIGTSTYTASGEEYWFSGYLALPSDTIVGPSSSVELLLNLTGNIKTAAVDPSAQIFIATINYSPSGSEYIGFTYQLTENGIDVGAPFGEDVYNGFGFPINNISAGFPIGDKNDVFNGIDVTLYNNTQDENVALFGATIKTGPAPAAPDTAYTLSLLGGAFACLAALRRRFAK